MARTLYERARAAKAWRRADGTWEVRLVLVPGGRQQSWYGPTEEAARAALLRAVEVVERNLDWRGGRELLKDYLPRWLEQVKPRLAYNTWRRHETNARVHVIPALGRVALDDLTARAMQDFLDRKATTPNPKTKKPLAPQTVKHIRGLLVAALADAERLEAVGENRARRTKNPPAATRVPEPLTPRQARALLASIRGDRLEALYMLAFATGMRQAEILGLRWQDVDLSTGTIRVRKQLERQPGRFVLKDAPKTQTGMRTIVVAPFVRDALLRRREARRRERAQPPDWRWWRGEERQPWWDELVFTTPAGAPLHSQRLRVWFKRHLADAGVPEQHFHDSRHFASSLLVALGVPTRAIMDMLGHADSTITHRYAHVWRETREHIAQQIEAAIAPEKEPVPAE